MQSSLPSWFALSARQRREKFVTTILRRKGFETFLPFITTRRRWSDRSKRIDEPLFPGYVFCRFNLQNRLPVLDVPGVVSIIGVGKTPIPIDDNEMESLQCVVLSGLPTRPWDNFEVGRRVTIEQGPLKGSRGIILEHEAHRNKLIVSISLLRRSVAVTIRPDWVRVERYI